MSLSPYALTIVRPLAITEAMILSTNIAEDDHPEWASGTTYAEGDRVILASTHRIYESLQADNTGKDPASETSWWIEVSPTNRWKAFDTSNSTRTKASGAAPTTITYTIRPGTAVSAVALLNVSNATSVQIVMTDPVHGVVYDETTSMDGTPNTASWWFWFFGTRRPKTQHIALDLPGRLPNADIEITLTGGTELAVGVILMGAQERFSLGVRHGARVGIRDYSRKETNEFGDTDLVRRAFARRADFSMLLEADEVDALQNTLSDLRAVPCLWVASDRYESTMLYGFYKNFEILISYHDYSDCELELEGLT